MAKKTLIIILLAFASVVSLPAKSFAGEGATENDILTVPFSPISGTDYLYEVIITKTTPTKQTITKFEQTLRYDQVDGGYIMTFTTLSLEHGPIKADLTSEAGFARMPPRMRPFFRPMSFDVSANGKFTGTRNWSAFLQSFEELLQGIQASKAEATADVAQASEARRVFIASYDLLKPEERPLKMLQGWPQLFSVAGTQLVAGREYEGATLLQSPRMEYMVPAKTKYVVSSAKVGGQIHLRHSVIPDHENMKPALESFSRALYINSNGAIQKRAANDAYREIKAIDFSQTSEANLDPATGMVDEATVTIVKQSHDGQISSDVLAIRRIRG